MRESTTKVSGIGQPSDETADVADETADVAVERVARLSFGKLVAVLASRTRDIALAEDILGESLMRALERWPESGVPRHPEAWLLTTAKRLHIDRARHSKVGRDAQGYLQLLEEERSLVAGTPELGADGSTQEIPDARLRLLFVCAHPAIDPRLRAPLMLQAVLGLDARRMASAFLLPPNTLGQRLVRAKAKIRAAAISFAVPAREELPLRLASVLDAIYAAYSIGWDGALGEDRLRKGLSEEAVWLGRLVVGLVPREAEALGLLSLMLHCEARKGARRSAQGSFVPLQEQDTALWSVELMEEADAILRCAGKLSTQDPSVVGRYQLEAAIQSVHAARRETNTVNWEALATLYEGLVRLSPTLGALVGRAIAFAEFQGPEVGLALLHVIDIKRRELYQPFWAARAHLSMKCGAMEDALGAYDRAIGLTEDDAVRDFLLREKQKAARS